MQGRIGSHRERRIHLLGVPVAAGPRVHVALSEALGELIDRHLKGGHARGVGDEIPIPFALCDHSQIAYKIGRGLVTVIDVLRQRLENHLVQARWQFRNFRGRQRRYGGNDFGDDLRRRRTGESALAGQQFEGDRAECEDIVLHTGDAAEPLRRHVGNRAGEIAGFRQLDVVEARQAKVENLRYALRRHADIRRFHIAVRHAVVMRVTEADPRLHQQIDFRRQTDRTRLFDDPREIDALYVLHHDE